VSACRLVPLKGLSHAISALKTLENEDWQYWIVGDGPERERLGALVEKLELSARVRFLGKKSQTETRGILAMAHAVLQPNLGPEGFGMTAAEACVLGVPVLAYDVPGLNEIVVNEQTGILAKFGQVENLALGLSRLLENETWARELGYAGRQRMLQHFSPEIHLRETLKNYQAALEK
jgi:glycosyltransferase involved in cell wall biosynthesis